MKERKNDLKRIQSILESLNRCSVELADIASLHHAKYLIEGKSVDASLKETIQEGLEDAKKSWDKLTKCEELLVEFIKKNKKPFFRRSK